MTNSELAPATIGYRRQAWSRRPPATEPAIDKGLGLTGRDPRQYEQPGTSLDAAKSRFLTAKRSKHLSPRTLDQYEWALGKFTNWLREHDVQEVGAITDSHIEEFMAEYESRGCEAEYVHGFARVIKTWLRLLHWKGLIAANPMATVEMPKLPRNKLPGFSTEEMLRLIGACRNTRERALLEVLLDTGLRAAELGGLNICDVDFEAGQVQVAHGKGDRSRVVHLEPPTIETIRRYLAERGGVEPGDPLFPSTRSGQRLTPNALLLICRRLGQRAGVEPCGPHRVRRTFASTAIRNGMNVYALQEMMGHADLETLGRYVTLTKADLAAEHRRCSPVQTMLRSGPAPERHS